MGFHKHVPLKYRKGQVEWIFIIAVLVCVFAIMIPITGTFLTSVQNNIGNSSAFDTQGIGIVNTVSANYNALWDNIFMFFFVGSWLALLVAFYFVNEHPVMAVFMIFFCVLFLILAPLLSNMYHAYAVSGSFVGADFPKLNYIMENYLLFAIAISLSCFGVLYMKGRMG